MPDRMDTFTDYLIFLAIVFVGFTLAMLFVEWIRGREARGGARQMVAETVVFSILILMGVVGLPFLIIILSKDLDM